MLSAEMEIKLKFELLCSNSMKDKNNIFIFGSKISLGLQLRRG